MRTRSFLAMVGLLTCVSFIGGCFLFQFPWPDGSGDPNGTTDPNDPDPNDVDEGDLDPNNFPRSRYGHTMVTVGDRVYVYGGRGEDQPATKDAPDYPDSAASGGGPILDDLWAFNSDNLNFDEVASEGTSSPGPLHAHSAGAWDGKFVLHGGKDPNDVAQGETWSYDPNANTWTKLSSGGPAVGYHSGVVIGDKLVVVGGTDGSTYSNETWVMDLNTKTWTKGGDYPGSPGLHAPAAGTYEGKLHVIDTDPNTVCVYTPGSDTWEKKAAGGTVPAPRSNAASCQVGPYLITVGGAGIPDLLKDSYTYDMSSGEYKGAGDDIPQPRYYPAMAVSDPNTGEGIVFGGMDESGDPVPRSESGFKFRLTTTFTNWSKFTLQSDGQ